jgi:hypothetical protein
MSVGIGYTVFLRLWYRHGVPLRVGAQYENLP